MACVRLARGLAGRGLAKLVRLGTCFQSRHSVVEACCRGGVAGAEPPHKGGRLRPTAQKRGERKEITSLASFRFAGWTRLSRCLRNAKVRIHFGMHPSLRGLEGTHKACPYLCWRRWNTCLQKARTVQNIRREQNNEGCRLSLWLENSATLVCLQRHVAKSESFHAIIYSK